jgi:hypothetical protein
VCFTLRYGGHILTDAYNSLPVYRLVPLQHSRTPYSNNLAAQSRLPTHESYATLPHGYYNRPTEIFPANFFFCEALRSAKEFKVRAKCDWVTDGDDELMDDVSDQAVSPAPFL